MPISSACAKRLGDGDRRTARVQHGCVSSPACLSWLMDVLETEGEIWMSVIATNNLHLSVQWGYGMGLPTGAAGAKFSPAPAPVNVEFGQLMKGASMTWLPEKWGTQWPRSCLPRLLGSGQTDPPLPNPNNSKRANGETKQDLWPLAISILALHKCRCLRWASTSASAWERESRTGKSCTACSGWHGLCDWCT